jgi:hypothetical protein
MASGKSRACEFVFRNLGAEIGPTKSEDFSAHVRSHREHQDTCRRPVDIGEPQRSLELDFDRRFEYGGPRLGRM